MERPAGKHPLAWHLPRCHNGCIPSLLMSAAALAISAVASKLQAQTATGSPTGNNPTRASVRC